MVTNLSIKVRCFLTQVFFVFNSKQIMVIFTAVIMLGSILGFAILYVDGDRKTNPPSDPDLLQTTQLNFVANQVPAKVERITNSLIVLGATKETEISKIDSAVLKINGVKGIRNSVYTQNNDEGSEGSLMYTAELLFDTEVGAENILEELQKIEILDAPQVFVYAIVSISKEVEFKNHDLNMTQTHVFADPRTQAVVRANVQKEDLLEVYVEASFAGARLISVNSFEEKNLTAEPKMVFLEKELMLSELEKELAVLARIKGSELDSIEPLIMAIEGIDEVDQASANFDFEKNYFEVTFSGIVEDENAVKNDFIEIADAEVFFEFDENKMYAFFEKDAILSVLKEKILDRMEKTGLEVVEFAEPFAEIEISVILSGLNAEVVSKEIEDSVEEIGFELVSIMQKAIIETAVLSEEDGTEYSVLDEKISARVTPGKKEGDLVLFSIFFQGVRKVAKNIQAQEATS
jgi:hypothetical protein